MRLPTLLPLNWTLTVCVAVGPLSTPLSDTEPGETDIDKVTPPLLLLLLLTLPPPQAVSTSASNNGAHVRTAWLLDRSMILSCRTYPSCRLLR